MSGEGFDACEYLWNHELQMRRLLSLLRQGQAYCTGVECLDELPGLGTPSNSDNLLTLFLMMAFAVMLFLLRPRSLRNKNRFSKPFNGGEGPSGAPPTPPPQMN